MVLWALLLKFQSYWSWFCSDAVLMIVLFIYPLFTVAVMVSVVVCPLFRVPIVQVPLVGLYVPIVAVAVWNVSPVGSRSVIVMPVAVVGPLFVVVMV